MATINQNLDKTIKILSVKTSGYLWKL